MYSGGSKKKLTAAGGNGQSAPVGRSLAKVLRVSIVGLSDTLIAGEPVQFEILSGDVRISHSVRTTDARGEA